MGTDSLQIENDMKEKKYHFVYKITNLINGKYYIGKHSTNKIDDNYMGSGPAIKSAIKKYGKDNFVKEILKFLDTEHDAYVYEESLLSHDVVYSKQCYNQYTGNQEALSSRNLEKKKQKKK